MSSRLIFPVKSSPLKKEDQIGHVGATYFDSATSTLFISDGYKWISLSGGNNTYVPTQTVTSRAISDSIVASSVQALKVLTVPTIRVTSVSPPGVGNIVYDTQSSSLFYSGPTGWLPISGQAPSNLSSVGSGISLVYNGSPPDLVTKSLVAGVGVSVSSNLTNTEVIIAGAYTAGTGITIGPTGVISSTATGGVSSFSAGTTGFLPNTATTGAISLSGILSRANGGTGVSTGTPTNGQLLIGDGTGYTLSTLTAGAGVTITNSAGSITIASSGISGVASFSGGTTGLTPNTPTAGVVTLAGVLNISNGGTGIATAPSNGQLLIGNGTNYSLSTLTAGAGITITNNAGSIAIASSLISVVTSITGTANQINTSATTGNVTLSLPADVIIANSLKISGLAQNRFLYSGAGGILTTTPLDASNGQLLIGSTGLAPVLGSITPGTAISVVNGPGTILIDNTGVTSLAGTLNQVIASSSTGAVTLSLPQSIAPSSSPTFNKVTITGAITNSTDAATKQYVDTFVSGLNVHESVEAATTTNLNAFYTNGTPDTSGGLGIGATITSNVNQNLNVAAIIDSYTLFIVGSRVLIKNQTNAIANGIYDVTDLGSGATPWILTRSADYNDSTPNQVGAGDIVYINGGSTLDTTFWVQSNVGTGVAPPHIILGTDNLAFSQFGGPGTYTAGNGLSLVGNQFSLTSPVTPLNGGTGVSANPSAGQILIGTSGNVYTPALLTSGTAINITSTSGSISIDNIGVTAISGTMNQINLSASTGSVVVSLPIDVTIANKLTVSGLTTDSFLYSSVGGLLKTTIAPTNGQLLIGSSGAPPVAANLIAGTGITITNGPGSITIDAIGGGGAVSSVTGTANQVTASPTSGNVVVGLPNDVVINNSLAVSGLSAYSFLYSGMGGLVASTAAYTSGQLLVGVTGSAPVAANLIAGPNITITNIPGSITIDTNGTLVNSVTGTANQISVLPTTGNVVVSLPNDVTITTSLTVSGLTANSFLYSDLGKKISATAAPTNGQLLIGSTGNAPVLSALTTSGAGISVTNGSGTITLANTGVTSIIAGSGVTVSPLSGVGAVTITATGVAGVSSFSGGTTGLTPSTATSGVITLAGTLSAANGGTGNTTPYSTGQLLIGNGTGLTKAVLTAGAGINITNGAGSITISATGGGAGVSSFSGGSSGLAPFAATTGPITLSGILNTVHGGTGNFKVPTPGQIPIGTVDGVYNPANIGVGSGLSIVNNSGNITLYNTYTTEVLPDLSKAPITNGVLLNLTQRQVVTFYSTSKWWFPSASPQNVWFRLGCGAYTQRVPTTFSSPIFIPLSTGSNLAFNMTPIPAPPTLTAYVFSCSVAGLYSVEYYLCPRNQSGSGNTRLFWAAVATNSGNYTNDTSWSVVLGSMSETRITNENMGALTYKFLMEGKAGWRYCLIVSCDGIRPNSDFTCIGNTATAPSTYPGGGSFPTPSASTVAITFEYIQNSTTL